MMLATEYCRRATFFRMWMHDTAPGFAFVYPPQAQELPGDDEGFLDFVLQFDAGHPVLERALSLRAMFPGAPQ